jgi:hypothetical protein
MVALQISICSQIPHAVIGLCRGKARLLGQGFFHTSFARKVGSTHVEPTSAEFIEEGGNNPALGVLSAQAGYPVAFAITATLVVAALVPAWPGGNGTPSTPCQRHRPDPGRTG